MRCLHDNYTYCLIFNFRKIVIRFFFVLFMLMLTLACCQPTELILGFFFVSNFPIYLYQKASKMLVRTALQASLSAVASRGEEEDIVH